MGTSCFHFKSVLTKLMISPYCEREIDGIILCRFNFPKPVSEEAGFDAHNRAFYKRTQADAEINPYCPLLLQIWKASMDIQVNKGQQVMHYLAKYLIKFNTHMSMKFMMETSVEHFRGRKVGIVDAIYSILGYHNHQSSIGVIYIDTSLPGQEQRRQLKTAEALARQPRDFFTRAHVEKYQHRHQRLRNLNMMEYFTYYKVTKFLNEDNDMIAGVSPEEEDPYVSTLDRQGYNNQLCQQEQLEVDIL